jgi:hypothetical protein
LIGADNLGRIVHWWSARRFCSYRPKRSGAR